MFHGTQCVPQQITDTFLLRNKVASMARSCVDDDSSAFVRDVLVKLTDNVRFKHKNDCSGLSLLGCGKSVMLDARKVVAVEALLDIDLHNQVGHLYDRFVYNHQSLLMLDRNATQITISLLNILFLHMGKS